MSCAVAMSGAGTGVLEGKGGEAVSLWRPLPFI